jgi:dTDP-4-amino-4,6-dideoxy-D-galactose acyltransferase
MNTRIDANQALAPAQWDSDFFGFAVARITEPGLSIDELDTALAAARQSGCTLVYWNAPHAAAVPPELLRSYAGQRVDQKATYSRSLRGDRAPAVRPTDTRADADYSLSEHPPGAATDALVTLALAAGWRSRFKVDRRFPDALFERMYRTWIDRSARREIADAVLTLTDRGGATVGMVTISVKGDTGQIGLIAIDAAHRGAGLGSRLMAAAHEWMLRRGLARAAVVTQLDNTGACRLYEREGYEVERVEDVYHFWPNTDEHR